jgi:hypothetical protein
MCIPFGHEVERHRITGRREMTATTADGIKPTKDSECRRKRYAIWEDLGFLKSCLGDRYPAWNVSMKQINVSLAYAEI